MEKKQLSSELTAPEENAREASPSERNPNAKSLTAPGIGQKVSEARQPWKRLDKEIAEQKASWQQHPEEFITRVLA